MQDPFVLPEILDDTENAQSGLGDPYDLSTANDQGFDDLAPTERGWPMSPERAASIAPAYSSGSQIRPEIYALDKPDIPELSAAKVADAQIPAASITQVSNVPLPGIEAAKEPELRKPSLSSKTAEKPSKPYQATTEGATAPMKGMFQQREAEAKTAPMKGEVYREPSTRSTAAITPQKATTAAAVAMEASQLQNDTPRISMTTERAQPTDAPSVKTENQPTNREPIKVTIGTLVIKGDGSADLNLDVGGNKMGSTPTL